MTKQYLFAIMFLLVPIFSFGQGISFESNSWEDLLEKASKEKKLIFLDAYTSWCGPCKQMTKKVFTSAKLGKYYNANFVNVKIDMEKGDGPMLRQKYDILAYPTLLYINAEGKLVHKITGYKSVKQMMDEGSVANDPKNNMIAQEERFEDGDRSPKFLRALINTKAKAMDGSHVPILKEYLLTQEDWTTDANMDLIYKYTESVESETFKYIVTNQSAFEEKFGKNEVTKNIQNMVFDKIHSSKNIKLEEIDELFEVAYPGEHKKMSSQYRMTYFRQRGDRAGYAESAIEHYSNYSTTDPGELNDVAWTFYEVVNDKKLLSHATKFAKKSIKLEKDHYNLDTLAHLYHKMGKNGKAIRTAKKAITFAEAHQMDSSGSSALIEKIKAGK